jgi:hypothetical protein
MRRLAAPFVVPPPTGARIRTRLRLSAWDEAVVLDILLALKGGDSNYATWKVGS